MATERVEQGLANEQLVIFQIDEGWFAFRLAEVAEIIRPPALARMPLAPASLLGLANLRGAVLPVVSVRRLLGKPDAPLDEATRVIVIDAGAPVGFLVDAVTNLLAVTDRQIERDPAGAGSTDPDLVDGAVKGTEGESTIKILNPQRLLRDDFRLGFSGPRAATRGSIATARAEAAAETAEQVSLVSFELARQEYALPLDRVQEIIAIPDQVSEVARSETAVLGVVTLRDRLLPLVSLRALLGLPSDVRPDERGRVVVVSLGNGAIGVVADRTREILRVDPGCMDPAPTLLTRGAGDAEITSICRLEEGKRLVAVLSPDRLFRSDLVRRVLAEQRTDDLERQTQTEEDTMADEQFIIFRLGEQEYGLPVGAVDEIARPPEHISRLPKAPAFVDGVMNLRGGVVPVIDLGRRFELGSREPGSSRRILVLAVGSGKAGFLVDSVSEVMKVPASAIRPAPELSPEQIRLIGRVANLEAQGRIILLLDPVQLLDQFEADMLAKFDSSQRQQAATPS